MKILKNASSNFNELLFENRNKNYGAYVIRKEYNERLIQSFFAAMLTLLLFAGSFWLMNRNHAETILPAAKNYIEQIKIEVDLSYLKNTPPPSSHPPKAIESTKTFNTENKVVPLVVKDPILPQEEKKIVEPISDPGPAQTGPDPVLTSSTGGPVDPGPMASSTSENYGSAMESAGLDKSPEFPGGEPKLMEFLSNNVHYPALARESGISGTVYATFIVDEFGKVKQVKIKRGIFSACDEEVLRVVKLFPDWKPGVYKGKNVAVIFNLPVKFQLGRN